MNYLIYASSATQNFSENDLKTLLAGSRENNTALGITGMLLYSEGNFIQVIEGELSAINSLYAKIGKDRRHTGLLQLIRGEIDTRNFSQWSMGFKTISPEDFCMLTGFEKLGGIGLQLANMEVKRPILVLLKNFLQINTPEVRYT